MNELFENIGKDLANGGRLNAKTGYELLTRAPMGRIMALAHQVRLQRFAENRVTFVFDTNPNYTNVCVTRCAFCAFCRSADDPESYLLSPDDLATRVKAAADAGATTVLVQGGHNPAVGLDDWLAYIRAIQHRCPDIHIHPFSPAEYVFMAEKEGLGIDEVLAAVYEAGIRTIPGGGAEILTESVRRQIAARKATTEQWLNVCEAAHRMGFHTTATMMFGHVESDADIVEHLVRLRDLQDRTGGFTSFIPWSFKPGDSPLGRKVPQAVHPAKYVRVIALARLMLDNFAHIQSSWFSESVPAGQLGLMAGADDFGGVLVEENVLQQAGHERSTTVERVKTIIRRAGFTPAQRDSNYHTLKVFDPPAPAGLQDHLAEPLS